MIAVTAQAASPTRFHPRVDAGIAVRIATGQATHVATAVDLSMAGARLVGDLPLMDERVTLAIPIPGERDVVTHGTVRRRVGESVAIEFDQLDWDDMIALARYVHPRMR